MLIFIGFLQVVACVFSYIKKLKHAAYFLGGSFLLNLFGIFFKYLNENNVKPYQGTSFWIFMASSACFLACPTLLLWLSSWKKVNISHWICGISFFGLLSSILIFYPMLSGALLLQVFYFYFLAMCFLSLFNSLYEFKEKPLMDKAMIAFLSVSGIIGYLVILFKLDYAFVATCNIISYLLIIALSYVAPRYTNLLPR